MNKKQYCGLSVGDLVRHRMSTDAMIVAAVVCGVPVLVRHQTMYNPLEWDQVDEAGRVIGDEAQPAESVATQRQDKEVVRGIGGECLGIADERLGVDRASSLEAFAQQAKSVAEVIESYKGGTEEKMRQSWLALAMEEAQRRYPGDPSGAASFFLGAIGSPDLAGAA